MPGSDPIVPSIRRVDGPVNRATEPPALRLARVDDIPACAEVWATAISDYQLRLNQPGATGDLEPLRRLLVHLRDTDPDRFWVATRPPPVEGDPERLVGFGSAVIRGPVWFLGMLFVHPEDQAAGLGRELLARTLPSHDMPILATATDSAQPVANALYVRYGIVPRLPVFHVVGRPERRGALPTLPSGITTLAFDAIAAGPPDGPGHRELMAAVAEIDRSVVGYEHPEDHRFLRKDGRVGYLYRGPGGAPLGYGYTSPVGRVGPVAALDEALLAPIVGHLLTVLEPRGASSLRIPGAAERTFRTLLEAGLRIEGFPALLCWSRPFASFERYLPISLALI